MANLNLWEKGIVYFVVSHRVLWANYFFLYLTYVGNAFIFLFLFLLPLYFLKKKSFSSGFIFTLISFALSFIFVYAGKHFLPRSRPCKVFPDIKALGPILKYGSFPSGHSAVAFAGAVMFSYFFPKYSYLFYILAFLVAFSRIYLGVHFPSDVLVGGVIGYLNGKMSIHLKRRYWDEKRNN